MRRDHYYLRAIIVFLLCASMALAYIPTSFFSYAVENDPQELTEAVEGNQQELTDPVEDNQQESADVQPEPADVQQEPAEEQPESTGVPQPEMATDETGNVDVTETEATVLKATAGDFNIVIKCGSAAGIPEGATLDVEELSGKQYDRYLEKTAKALDTDEESLDYVKLLNLKIMYDGEEIQPESAVDVSIQLKDRNLNAAKEDINVVHFGKKAEVLDAEVNSKTDKVSFETDGFSIYAVTSKPVTDLDGKTLAIVHVSTTAIANTNESRHLGRAMKAASYSGNANYLANDNVTVEIHENEEDIVTSTDKGAAEPNSTVEITEWAFESASGTNQYYIKAGEKYLNISSTALTLSDTPQALTVDQYTGTNADLKGTVRIHNGNYYVRSSVARTATSNASNTNFQVGTYAENYACLTLCATEKLTVGSTVYVGDKISVQDLVDGGEYIIYRTLYNSATDKYEDYVIDHDGQPLRAYDKGEQIKLYGDEDNCPVWMLHVCTNESGQPTGYYEKKKKKTGMILHPLSDGTMLKEYDEATVDTQDGVTLAGRQNGHYTSTINFWDGSAMGYYGYHITEREDTPGQFTTGTGTGHDSQTFSFAKRKTDSSAGLHEVETVDSKANGININMFNYGTRNQIVNVTGSDAYALEVLQPQHVKWKLNEDGYPVFNNGNSGKALFDTNGSYYQGEANHLFLEDIYNSTGYYEYSSFNNFAHYNKNNKEFTVYSETGTPNTSAANFFYKRGNFMPFNNLNTANSAARAQNLYNGDGILLDYQNPSFDTGSGSSSLYGLAETADYYFGMTMDYDFMMPRDGLVNDDPLIYEFNGDDDLWIFIDGVLIMDIGGVHDAWSGHVNFATGQITGKEGIGSGSRKVCGAGGATTIKDCFKKAGVFPDGTAWDDSKVDEYFRGDTFVDYGGHSFKMFYMEHGASASNLEMRFNMPVIEMGKFVVEKQLDNTSQVDYANVDFAYQAFKEVVDVETGESRYVLMGQSEDEDGNPMVVYEGRTDDDGKPVPLKFYDNVTIGGVNYDNVFYLKPKEAAVFSDIADDQNYYVQELGIKSEYYDQIFVNDVSINGQEVKEDGGIYKSTKATPRNRARVTYRNRCNENNSNELQITKRLPEGCEGNGDSFEFRVMLENASGVLSPYYQGKYYIRDDNGVYYKYEGGELVSNGQTPYELTAGNYGTIAKIPPGFTVVLKGLLAGTDFYVDEIRVNKGNSETNSVLLANSGWELVDREIVEGSCDPPEIDDATIWDYATSQNINGSSLGRIKLGEDAHVIFTNTYQKTDLEIYKTLPEYISHDPEHEADVHASFSFRVRGYNGKNEEILNTVAGISFDASSSQEGKALISNIPSGVVRVTVEELESADYSPDPADSAVQEAELLYDKETDRKYFKVSFKNKVTDDVYEGGVINRYVKDPDTGKYVKQGERDE